MKLIISIVHRDDRDGLLDALMAKGHRATCIGTTGGFLRQGNATILVGTEEDSVSEVLSIIDDNCCSRTEIATIRPFALDPLDLLSSMPMEVEVGGATVFVLEVADHHRY